MHYSSDGLKLSKDELGALLAFASNDKGREDYYGVHFLSENERVKARASTGAIALDAIGSGTGKKRREWFVDREFLKHCHKSMASGSHSVLLQFSGASLNAAEVQDGDGIEILGLQWPHEAAKAQHRFDEAETVKEMFTAPTGKAVKAVTLDASYMALMTKVSKAAGVDAITCFVPSSSHERTYFQCASKDTTWTACLVPSAASDSEADPDAEGE